jgi:hypothetical protein|tara:strand:- start:15459 stop:15791 length:333 start_codon:yes stop_codon:yes gene_type:complete
MMNRTEALKQIVTFGADKEAAYSELVKFGYDSEIAYFVVSKSVLEDVLLIYLADKITADELEEWANFVECRDDLDYEIIEGYIYALANPYLVGDISKEKITKMVQLLKAT